MQNMKIKFLLVLASLVCLPLHAQNDKIETVTSTVHIQSERAKGGELYARLEEITKMVQAKQFTEAEAKAIALRKVYEALFEPQLKQFTFHSRQEYLEFKQTSNTAFEWIDSGYSQCLGVMAFVASERKDFAAALALLEKIESVSPASAGPATETGYVLNQMRKPAEGLAAYRRSLALATKYTSQKPYQAMALRGIGGSLIDLNQLDEAEKAFQESLKIEPGNKVALNELAFIRGKRGGK